jgi:hypothetical protein
MAPSKQGNELACIIAVRAESWDVPFAPNPINERSIYCMNIHEMFKDLWEKFVTL